MAHRMYLPTTMLPMPGHIEIIYPLHIMRPKPHYNTLTTFTHTHTHNTIHWIHILPWHIPRQALTQKHAKYDPLINIIQNKGWKTNPLITIIAGVRGAIHVHSIEFLADLKIPKTSIKNLMKNIHRNALIYLIYLTSPKQKKTWQSTNYCHTSLKGDQTSFSSFSLPFLTNRAHLPKEVQLLMLQHG